MLLSKALIITLTIRRAMNNFWQEKIKICGHEVPRFMTAPLDGVTDSPFRQVIREFSPDILMFGEMRHVDTVANERTGKALIHDPGEQPLVFQFSANRTPFIGKAVDRVLDAGFKAINLNSACPAPAIIRSGSGSALMGNIPQLKIILEELQRCIAGRVPLSIKIRAGFKHKNAVEVAQIAQDMGCDTVIIHPRTQPERFAARLDYDLVAQVKKALTIPVVFSGNITKFEIAQRVYDLTGCDGFMIGRALLGAPWKIKEMTEHAAGRTFTTNMQTSFASLVKHLDNNSRFYGTHGYAHFKKHLAQYLKGFAGATEWRDVLLRTQSEQEMRQQLEMLKRELLKAVTTERIS